MATCKHIAAVLFGLEEFSRLGFTNETVTCTERLQQWNRPHAKKIVPMSVLEMDCRKTSLGKELVVGTSGNHRARPKHTAADLVDPRPSSKRGKTMARINALLEERVGKGKVSCMYLAAGSTAAAAVEKKQRLSRAQEQKSLWHKQRDGNDHPPVNPDVHEDVDQLRDGPIDAQPETAVDLVGADTSQPHSAIRTMEDFYRVGAHNGSNRGKFGLRLRCAKKLFAGRNQAMIA